MTIDQWSPTPIFQQLADILEADIKAGTYAPGSPLPSEMTLAQRYGVSRGTVRRATEELRERGLVITLPQRGTFVRPVGPKAAN
jgi:GntR family transcriptional regulator